MKLRLLPEPKDLIFAKGMFSFLVQGQRVNYLICTGVDDEKRIDIPTYCIRQRAVSVGDSIRWLVAAIAG